jgi:transposase
MRPHIPNQPSFKAYHQHQVTLLPPSLDELIPLDHPVRVVNRIVDEIDLSPLVRRYKPGGTSSYHPVMLLKVLLYAYLRNIYSTRKIEEAIGENIHFMWLSGGNRPDHNTLARFRSERLKDQVEYIFSQTVHLLADAGLISLKEAFVDGTKIEANANRYTFVWGKAITYHRERIQKQLDELIAYANQVAKSEESLPSIKFDKIDADMVRSTIADIDRHLAGSNVDKSFKRKLNNAEKNWPLALERYDEQERILDGRNSYSKTDEDAVFMRTKDDHMGNGQLKPCYNVQVSTENQYVTNLTVHDNPADTTTLPEHLESFRAKHGTVPQNLTADAGYGSNENYTLLEGNDINAYVKYPTFHREQSGKLSPFHPDRLEYRTKDNTFICPGGRVLRHLERESRMTPNGFVQYIDRYRSDDCTACQLRSECYSGKENRTIEVNHELRRQKADARKNLLSEEGMERRRRRNWEVETFFGDIKHNRIFKRFNLRGIANVLTESLVMAMAYNIRKMPAYV